jgi:carbamoyl-phosphate synthase large subunit
MNSILFQDNQMHSTYSDGKFTLEEIFEYNNLHDKLDLIITDHVDKNTDWFPRYVRHIQKLRKKYKDFSVRIGCEVKILDDGTLNTTPKIIKTAEVVIGSVHHFDGIKTMSEKELLKREYELTKLLAQNKDIDILGHPFSMLVRFFKSDVPREYVEEIYALCAKNGIKFEYNHKNSPESIITFVRELIATDELEHLSFGSDMHASLAELGQSGYAMQKPVTVLVTGGGTAIAQGILKGLQRTGLTVRTVVVDTDILAAGLYAGDMAYRVPQFKDAGFVSRIIEICKCENVDVVFCGLDPELSVLAKNATDIKKTTGAHVIVSPLRAVKIADDKWETVQFLKKNNFPYPKSCLPKDVEIFLKSARFPLVVKPRIGARSIGLSIVKNRQELKNAIEHTPDVIIQEHLSTDNDEFTCSAFVWRGRAYGVACGKRWLRNGDTYKAHFYQNPKLESFIAKVATKLGVEGPCNFQLRMTNRGPVIFEINARFSGTTGSVAHLGFNVPSAIAHIVGANRSPWKLSFKDSYVLRYWNEIFADEEGVHRLKKTGMLKPSKKDTNAL